MPDYKEMYFRMFKASERAIELLIAVQQECEELLIFSAGTELKIIELWAENKRDVDE